MRILSRLFQCDRIRNYFLQERWEDQLAFGVILGLTPLLYFHGVGWLIPDVMENHDGFAQFLAYALATWCAIGILSNMYLIRLRHSSIRFRFLKPPVIAAEPVPVPQPQVNNGCIDFAHVVTADGDASVRDRHNQVQIKTLGQQFMVKPFGSDEAWHICATCEVYVPPRAWHCKTCNVCILRRDHHCVFVKRCIGEENHANFLGLMFYLCLGTGYSSFMSFLYSLKNVDMQFWWYIVRCMVPVLSLPFDFTLKHWLSCVALLGFCVSAGMFGTYFTFASFGETAGDVKLNRRRSAPGTSRFSYRNLRQFLGPYPIYRILWPFHRLIQSDCTLNSPSKQDI